MNDHFQKGIKLYELNRYAEARKEFESCLAAYPRYSLANAMVSLCYSQEENYEAAIKYAWLATNLDATAPINHYVLGVASAGLEDYPQSIDALQKAIELDPGNAAYHTEIGRVYLLVEIYGKAKVHLDKALELQPSDVEALRLKSYLSGLLSKEGESQELIDNALGIDPTNATLLFEKAKKEEKKGNYQTAAELYQLALAKKPGEWLYQEKVLDAHMGQHFWYKWLVLKFRLFYQAAYLILIFDLCFIPLSGLIINPDNAEEPYFLISYYLIVLTSCWQLLFWLTRMLGHLYMSKKLWNLSPKFLFNIRISIQLNASLAYICFS